MAGSEILLRPREAAAALGVSYATIKQWILAGSLKTVQTPGGHHRIPESSLAPLVVAKGRIEDRQERSGTPAGTGSGTRGGSRERFRAVSGRNQLVGTIVELKISGLMAQVVLAVGEQRVTAIITAEAAREMQLRKGQTAAALMKSTEVMIERV
jgi:molybdopterin-binding protein